MNKKMLVFIIAVLLGSGAMLNAQKGGYTGQSSPTVSVKQAKNLKDDSPVILRGKILRYLGNDKYLFSDGSETITIEIKNRLWQNISVSENDEIEISGEVDKEFAKIEIEVSRIRKTAESQATQGSGYTGPSVSIVSVKQAKNLRDDSPVILRGKILRFLGDEKYLFSDDSGSITVEIDDHLWQGVTVSENDTVEISGKLDKEFAKIEIEVSSIKKVAGR